jgi:AcrR family transcriptional regulator
MTLSDNRRLLCQDCPMTPAPAAGTLRERKKRKTRETLIAVGLDMFNTHGYAETTVEAIAEAVEISPRTFFRYFDSKEEIVFADAEEDLTFLRNALHERPSEESALEAIREALISFAEYEESKREKVLSRTRLMSSTPALALRGLGLQKRYERVLIRELTWRSGLKEPTLMIRLIASVCLSAMVVASDIWREGRSKETLTRLTRNTFAALTEAIAETERTPGQTANRRRVLS